MECQERRAGGRWAGAGVELGWAFWHWMELGKLAQAGSGLAWVAFGLGCVGTEKAEDSHSIATSIERFGA